MNEGSFQAQSAALHALAPLLFTGSAWSRLAANAANANANANANPNPNPNPNAAKPGAAAENPGAAAPSSVDVAASPSGGAPSGRVSSTTRAINRSIAIQSIAQLSSWLLIVAVCAVEASAWPWLMYAGSQLLWLSPLNLNWLWTCPHLCERGSRQPTVSFYTPDSPLGKVLDAYMGWENYHVEHHDFPDIPMYNLPKLKAICPEYYTESLRCMPVLELDTWREALSGEFVYACQDATFGNAAERHETSSSST